VPRPGLPISPWITLGDGELFVVPKLGALSPEKRFEAEIRSRVHALDVEVVA
jgi:hypothetical protein